jgi:hypothetical protein
MVTAVGIRVNRGQLLCPAMHTQMLWLRLPNIESQLITVNTYEIQGYILIIPNIHFYPQFHNIGECHLRYSQLNFY